jgi:hypothetical protein
VPKKPPEQRHKLKPSIDQSRSEPSRSLRSKFYASLRPASRLDSGAACASYVVRLAAFSTFAAATMVRGFTPAACPVRCIACAACLLSISRRRMQQRGAVHDCFLPSLPWPAASRGRHAGVACRRPPVSP